MSPHGWKEVFFSFFLILTISPLAGRYLFWIYKSGHLAVEKQIYRFIGVDPDQEMTWKDYAFTLLLSNALFFVAGYFILWGQAIFPLNPRHLSALSPELVFNTAASFVTNSDWQAYAGEAQLSNFSQTAAVTFLMFVAPATGITFLIPFIRGLSRSSTPFLGNFWSDFVRIIVRGLLPFGILFSLLHVWQGTPQTLRTAITAHTLEGQTQTLIMGPVASLESIKQLGTNGAGFYNTNSAHPYENPTPLSNMIEILEMSVFTFSIPFFFGRMVGRPREGWILFAVVFSINIAGFFLIDHAERSSNPILISHKLLQTTNNPSIKNMEGKEVRFGITQSTLYTNASIATFNGGVNSAIDSMNPVSISVLLSYIVLGDVPGGKGVGFLTLLREILLALFLVGMMVGRQPEYLGKKIENREIKFVSLSFLVIPLLALGITAVAVLLPQGKSSIGNPGPHGFLEVLYGFASSTSGNGSAMAGLTVSTTFYALSQGFGVLLGRYLPFLPLLALAGSFAQKRKHPSMVGTFQTDTGIFGVLLVAFMLILGVLIFLPALILGPILEHLSLQKGILY